MLLRFILLVGTTIFIYAFKTVKTANVRPNIVWIVCEDMSPHLGAYGEKVAKTPRLDQLATESVKYTNVFSTAGVCAPSRCAIITGCYQTSVGGHHMRTLVPSAVGKDSYPEGFKSYSAVLPPDVKGFSQYLRASGYYCSNNAKEDYQFVASPTMWDESSGKAHWRNRKDKSQPFFSVFNLGITHESQVWTRAKMPLLVNPKDVEVPPYYPDDSVSRNVIARFLSNVMEMDRQVGQLLDQLKADGLYENTIIFFYSDHGDGLPYVKRELHHRGLRVPMLIKAPFLAKGQTDAQLISFIDLAPTVLSLAGVTIPKSIQGQAFLGDKKSSKPRKYIYAARDRMDSEYDRVRSVSDGRYNYLRNYRPELPHYQSIQYRLSNPLMPHLLKLRDEAKLNAIQMRWFAKNKPIEELYDTQNDPFELNNLANNPTYTKKLTELKQAHKKWVQEYNDLGELNEMEMVGRWWNGQQVQPKTEVPIIEIKGELITLRCNTEGASIGYRKSIKDAWTVYQKPFRWQKGDSLYVVSHRIGYSKVEKSIVSQ